MEVVLQDSLGRPQAQGGESSAVPNGAHLRIWFAYWPMDRVYAPAAGPCPSSKATSEMLVRSSQYSWPVCEGSSVALRAPCFKVSGHKVQTSHGSKFRTMTSDHSLLLYSKFNSGAISTFGGSLESGT